MTQVKVAVPAARSILIDVKALDSCECSAWVMASVPKKAGNGQPRGASAQSDVIAFLGVPETYGQAVEKVDRIDTHSAIVFLVGNRAFKLKRAVKLPYLDFSTLAKREASCRHEIARNKEASPDIYIGVLPVTRQSDGHLELDGDGDPVDWVVVMNRFEQAELFDNLASEGCLPLKYMGPLAEHIAAFHLATQPAASIDGSNIMAEVITQVVTALFQTSKDFVALEEAQNFAGRIVSELNAQSRLLRSRSHRGLVRLCHGDMHLRNIVLHNAKPALFDAIEFDDRLATIDLFYDLAFLLMDLWHRDLQSHANLCFGTYVSKAVANDELDGLAAMPLFLSVRAAIRAMVAIDKLAVSDGADRQQCIAEIESYLVLAMRFLEPARPVLIAVGGLSGTGKTTVAASIAPNIGRAPGALHLRSDVERKRMADVDPLKRLPATAYTKRNSDKVYKRLFDRAERALKAGQAVVVDAVFQEASHRRAIEQVAARARVPFFGVWLEAPQEKLIERVAGRRDDASDADAAVIRMQFTKQTTVTCWDNVDASAAHGDVLLQVHSAMSARIGQG